MPRNGLVLSCAVALLALLVLPGVGACGRSDATKDEERPRLRSGPSNDEPSTALGAAATSASAQKQSTVEDASSEIQKAKDVCNKLGEALKKEGKTKWRKIAKRVQSCVRKAALLEKEDAALYACVARCAIKAEAIADFDKCDQQCDQSGKKNVSNEDE